MVGLGCLGNVPLHETPMTEPLNWPTPPATLVGGVTVNVSDSHVLITFLGVVVAPGSAEPQPAPLFTAALPASAAPALAKAIMSSIQNHKILVATDESQAN